MSGRIMLKFITDVEDPREVFDMVMAYADRTKKNTWTCLGEVLNPDRYTIIIYELDNTGDYYIPMGYSNMYINDENDLFFHHGYLHHSIKEYKEVLEDMCRMVQSIYLGKLNKVIIHSEAGRLWKKYGFEISKMEICKRDMPHAVNRGEESIQ